MSLKTSLAAAALTIAPILAPAVAGATCSGHDTQAMSCAEGSAWDAGTQSCVPQVTG